MARKPFLVRLDPAVLAAIEAWAADDLRSVNAQIEFLLREALRKAGRKVRSEPAADDEPAAVSPAAPAAPPAPAPEKADAAVAPIARRGVRSR